MVLVLVLVLVLGLELLALTRVALPLQLFRKKAIRLCLNTRGSTWSSIGKLWEM